MAAHTARARAALRQPTSRDFLASCYELLLGRELEDPNVFRSRANLTAAQLIESVIGCEEFEDAVYRPLASGSDLPDSRFAGAPSIRQRYWAADRLPILNHSSEGVERATNWLSLLRALCSDAHLMTLAGLPMLS